MKEIVDSVLEKEVEKLKDANKEADQTTKIAEDVKEEEKIAEVEIKEKVEETITSVIVETKSAEINETENVFSPETNNNVENTLGINEIETKKEKLKKKLIIHYFFSLLENKNINTTLLGYFCKIMQYLLFRRQQEVSKLVNETKKSVDFKLFIRQPEDN